VLHEAYRFGLGRMSYVSCVGGASTDALKTWSPNMIGTSEE